MVCTSGRGLSILTIILGSCVYVYAKSQEAAAPSAYVPLPMKDLEEGRAGEGDDKGLGGGDNGRRD